MSRLYQFDVHVDYIPGNLVEKVKKAIASQYGFSKDSEFYTAEDEDTGWCLEVSEELSLGGGTSDEEHVEEIAHAIWDATKMYVEIRINTIYLENLPTETYYFEEEEYEEWREDHDGELL